MKRKEFTKLIKSRPGALARELMKQNIVSGVGNYILSECLYDTKLHPLIECKDLTKKQAKNLYNNIVEIMIKSIKYKGVSIRDYRPLTQRKERNDECGTGGGDNTIKGTGQKHLKVYKQNKDPNGYSIEVIKKGPHGRAIHWCPKIQI